MKVALLSQAYLVAEFRKGLHELGQTVDLLVVSPREMRGRSWRENVLRCSTEGGEGGDYSLLRLPSIRLFGAQYLFVSLTLGIRRFRPDVIHIDSDPWAVVFWQAMLSRSLFAPQARVVAMVKKNTYRRYPGLRGRLKRWVAAMGIERVDHFVSASEMTARLYQREFGVERDRLTVATHIGVDTGAFRPTHSSLEGRDEVIVGYCGRLTVEKGVTDLFEAVAICRSRTGLDVRLLMLGAGPLHRVFTSDALDRRWLQVCPPVPNHRVPEFLSAIDVFALPSRVSPDHEEHDAHALLEALATGVPTIGTRSGIISELLGDGTGVLVNAGRPRELAEGLHRLLTSPRLQADLAERGRAKAVQCFSLVDVARQRVSVYSSVLADG